MTLLDHVQVLSSPKNLVCVGVDEGRDLVRLDGVAAIPVVVRVLQGHVVLVNHLEVKPRDVTNIFPRTEQTFASARSFGVIS